MGRNIGYSKEGKESIFNIEMIEENQNTMALGGGGISKIVIEERNGIGREIGRASCRERV